MKKLFYLLEIPTINLKTGIILRKTLNITCFVLMLSCSKDPVIVDDPSKVSLKSAQQLIRERIFELNPDMNPEWQFTIKELTTDEIWQKTNIQVYNILDEGFAFIVDHEVKKVIIGLGFSYLDDVIVSDLNQDGKYELLFITPLGSYYVRGRICMFVESDGEYITNDSDLSYFYHQVYGTLKFEKIDDVTVNIVVLKEDYIDILTSDLPIGNLSIVEEDYKEKLQFNQFVDIPKIVEERIHIEEMDWLETEGTK